jgi:glycine oxidase
MKVDYIVVGQGLAGSAVAVQLLKLKKKIVVFDDPSANNSSRIAAGLFNPVTGKKMVRTWLADKLFPYLHQYYTSLEKETGKQFFHPMPLYRPFISVEEQNEWMVRSGDPLYMPYVDKVVTDNLIDGVIDPYGGLLLRQCGFLHTMKYIQAVSILIEQNGTLNKELFLPEHLIFREDHVVYKDYEAAKIIWCTGVHKNTLLDWLPIRPLKGETLSIKTELPVHTIINRGVYMGCLYGGHGRKWNVASWVNVPI